MPRQLAADISLKSRNKASLNSPIEKKLLAYAALAGASGVGILALVQPSEAEIVYTPVRQVLTPNQNFGLDLNGDGITDFSFRIASFFGGRAKALSGHAQTFSEASSAFLWIYPAKSNAVFGRTYVSALPAGVNVGKNSGRFLSFSRASMGGVEGVYGTFHPRYFGPWAPAGGRVQSHYVGLKFVIEGQVHFGWARFNVRMRKTVMGGVRAMLTGYAYETEANTPIETGNTSGPRAASVQPATLGHLSLGTAGLAAWRREPDDGGTRQ